MADAEGSANLNQRLASLPPRQGLPPLMRCELDLATELDAPRLSPLPALIRPSLY